MSYRPGYTFEPAWTSERRPALFARRFRDRAPGEAPDYVLHEGESVTVVAYEDGAVLCTCGGGVVGYLDSVEREKENGKL